MMGNDVQASNDACVVQLNRLDRYRRVIDAAIKRSPDHEDKQLAEDLNMDRSYFSKMRRGLRPMPPRILDQLVDMLKIDRVRLALAVNMMEDPLTYFDPNFKNLCTYMQVVIIDTMKMAAASGDEAKEFCFGSLSPERCEALAQAAVQQINDQFTALGAVPVGPQNRRVA